MPLVNLDDIRLAEYTLNLLGRLARLREERVAAPVEICIERARHITAYMKHPDVNLETNPPIFRLNNTFQITPIKGALPACTSSVCTVGRTLMRNL